MNAVEVVNGQFLGFSSSDSSLVDYVKSDGSKTSVQTELNTINDALANKGDVLFEGTITSGGTATLSKSIADYTMIIVEYMIGGGGNGKHQSHITKPNLNDNVGNGGTFNAYGSWYSFYYSVIFTTNTTIKFANEFCSTYSAGYICRVIGIK